MRRNISIENNQVNEKLDSLPKGSRSNYIEQCILLKIDFDESKFVEKDMVYSLINEVLKYMQVTGDFKISDNNNSDVMDVNVSDDTLKQSIINILKM